MYNMNYEDHHEVYINEIVRKHKLISSVHHIDISELYNTMRYVDVYSLYDNIKNSYSETYEYINIRIKNIIITELVHNNSLDTIMCTIENILLEDINDVLSDRHINELVESIDTNTLSLYIINIYNKLKYLLGYHKLDLVNNKIVMAINHVVDNDVVVMTIGVRHGERRG